MAPYAYLCDACGHLASRHFLDPDGDLRAGPYRCTDCGCTIRQDDPVTGLTEGQYHEWAAEHPDNVWREDAFG